MEKFAHSRWIGVGTLVAACCVPSWAVERPARTTAPVRRAAAAPSFLNDYLAPELAKHTEGFSSYVASPAYGFHRDSASAGHFETVAGIEHGTVRAVRRAAREWLLEATGAERLTLTFRPFAEALDRVDERWTSAKGDSETRIRVGFSSVYPRIVVERPTSAGEFRFAATLDGRATADFKPTSPRSPWMGADVDVRDRSARFRLGLAF